MAPIHVIIPGKPMVWSRPRVSTRSGKVVMFDPKAQERKNLGLLLKSYFSHPLDGPVKLEVIYFHATKKKKLWGEYKHTRFDLDNAIKALNDALNGIAFIDDGQVCCISAQKKWAEKDATHVFVSKL
jgi:Holliday junction resolvase RusA-like endonuclease